MISSCVENSSSCVVCKVKFVLMGLVFVVVIGYIDLGNFVINIQVGVSFGYQLLWVVVWVNLMVMLIQVFFVKLGIVIGKNLVEQICDYYLCFVVWFYWVQVEIIVMVIDLVEFIGVVIGFKLVFGVLFLQGVVLIGVVIFLILMLQWCG